MTREQRRAGRAIRKARRQVAELTDQQRQNLTDAVRRMIPLVAETFDVLRSAFAETVRFVAECGRAMLERGRAAWVLWPPHPVRRPLIHNGRKPR